MTYLVGLVLAAAVLYGLWQRRRARQYEEVGNELKAALEQVTLDRYEDSKQYEVLVLDLKGCLARMKLLDGAAAKTLRDDLQALADFAAKAWARSATVK